MIRSKGKLSKRTRRLGKKEKPTVNQILQKFEIGDLVAVDIKRNAKNIPHPRFNGKVGRIIEKRGKAYVVEIKEYNIKKKIIALPVDLRKVGE
ncbi:MAG: 50S ribosomal protein L21e [Candidatus Micrarchaeia archaeon]|jgi:large subunit ribosomal protein L21e